MTRCFNNNGVSFHFLLYVVSLFAFHYMLTLRTMCISSVGGGFRKNLSIFCFLCFYCFCYYFFYVLCFSFGVYICFLFLFSCILFCLFFCICSCFCFVVVFYFLFRCILLFYYFYILKIKI